MTTTKRTTNDQAIADAIRKVTATIQHELDAGRRSSYLDAADLVDVLLAIADEIDPPFDSKESR